jgi:hypothetical protein
MPVEIYLLITNTKVIGGKKTQRVVRQRLYL